MQDARQDLVVLLLADLRQYQPVVAVAGPDAARDTCQATELSGRRAMLNGPRLQARYLPAS